MHVPSGCDFLAAAANLAFTPSLLVKLHQKTLERSEEERKCLRQEVEGLRKRLEQEGGEGMVTLLKAQVDRISAVAVQFHILVRVLSRVLTGLMLLLSLAAPFYCLFVAFVGDFD